MSYLTSEEKKALASSTISAKTKWQKTRQKVIQKVVEDEAKMSKIDNILKEILIVCLKIYYELKKPK